jgi:hypothetical protein
VPVNGPLGDADLFGDPPDGYVLASEFNNQFPQSVDNLLAAQCGALPFLKFPGHRKPSISPHGDTPFFTRNKPKKQSFFIPAILSIYYFIVRKAFPSVDLFR